MFKLIVTSALFIGCACILQSQTTDGDCSPVVNGSSNVSVNCKSAAEPYSTAVIDIDGDTEISDIISFYSNAINAINDEKTFYLRMFVDYSAIHHGETLFSSCINDPNDSLSGCLTDWPMEEGYKWEMFRADEFLLGLGKSISCQKSSFEDSCIRFQFQLGFPWLSEDPQMETTDNNGFIPLHKKIYGEAYEPGIPPGINIGILNLDAPSSHVRFVRNWQYEIEGFFEPEYIGGHFGRSYVLLRETLVDPARAEATLLSVNEGIGK